MHPDSRRDVIRLSAVCLLALCAVAALLLCSGDGYADDGGSCGQNLTWTYSDSSKELTISGSGEMNDNYTVQTAPWYPYHGEMKKLTLSPDLWSVGHYAFYQCDGLTGTLAIPDQVDSIGFCAFQECSGFTGTLVIPGIVTSIGNYAFQNCSGFTGTLVIPGDVEYVGSHAFEGCTGILTISISPGASGIDGSAFLSHTFYEEDGTTVIDSRSEGFVGYTFTGESPDKMIRSGQYVPDDAIRTDSGENPDDTLVYVSAGIVIALAAAVILSAMLSRRR